MHRTLNEIAPLWSNDFPIQASAEYAKAIGDVGLWLALSENSMPVLAMPFIQRKRGLVFSYVQILSPVLHVNGEKTIQEESAFLDRALEHFKSKGVISIIQPPSSTLFRCRPRECKWCRFGSYVVNLTSSEDSLLKAMHQKHRNSVRSALKKGVFISFGIEHVDLVYQLTKETMQRSGIFFNEQKFFRSAPRTLGKNLLVAAAFVDGQPQGGAIVPFSRFAGYYLFGGSARTPVSGAMNLLHWEIMLRLKSMGVLQYDFVGARINPPAGSKLEGIQRFKERFGGALKEGILWKKDLRPTAAFGFRFLQAIKHRQWPQDIIDQEMHRNYDTVNIIDI